MKVNLVNNSFKDGVALVVGKTIDKDKFSADSTVLHTAYCLSKNPYYIDYCDLDLRIVPKDCTLYICGHGSRKKETIGGRSVSDIAKVLVQDRKYEGHQDIYVTSCESKPELVKMLSEAISKELGFTSDRTVNVESRTTDGSITINNSGVIEQYDVISENDNKYFEYRHFIYRITSFNTKYCKNSILEIDSDKIVNVNEKKIKLLNKFIKCVIKKR